MAQLEDNLLPNATLAAREDNQTRVTFPLVSGNTHMRHWCANPILGREGVEGACFSAVTSIISLDRKTVGKSITSLIVLLRYAVQAEAYLLRQILVPYITKN